MKKYLTLLVAGILTMGGLLAPGAATAIATGTIPAGAGGGTFAVELTDFQYPVTNGCYEPTTSYFEVNYATPRPTDDYVVLELTVRDSIGRVEASYFELEETGGRFGLDQSFCFSSDVPGTYTATGELRFRPSGLVVPVSDSYTISNPPAAAPVPATSPAAPPAAGTNSRCVKAKAALKRVKKQDKPFSVIQKAKKKKARVC